MANRSRVGGTLSRRHAAQASRRIIIENRDQGGDATRGMGPFFLGQHDSHFFQTFNLNKKSVTLNLKLPEGRDNERRGWPGYDYLMQAEAGYLHLTGEPGTPPARMGLSIVDFMTGITTSPCTSSPTRATGT